MYIIFISLFFVNLLNAAEEKCTWNILNSNCKFQKITDKAVQKATEGKDKIKSSNPLKLKLKK